MRTPRDLNGRKLANHLIRRWRFEERKQTGSHIILTASTPSFHISIPDHKPLRVGTLQAIIATVAKQLGVTPDELLWDL